MLPRRRPYACSSLAVAIVLSCRYGAAAAPPNLHVSLDYSADPGLGCPSASDLSASIASQLGYEPFTADGEQRLRVEVTKVGDGAEARIEWIDRQLNSEGERSLTSDSSDCAPLARSLAFAVAVQIQLHASADEPPAPPSPPPPPPPQSKAPVPSSKEPVPQPQSAPPRRLLLLGAGAMARHGVTPGVSPGLRVFGALSKDWWSFELSGHATLPARLQLEDGTGFDAYELGANLAPCWRHLPVGVCAVGAISLLHVRGRGVDRIRSPSALTGGAGARLQLLLPVLARFGVVVQAEALAVLAPQDVLVNQTKVWSTSPVAISAILDFAATFP